MKTQASNNVDSHDYDAIVIQVEIEQLVDEGNWN